MAEPLLEVDGLLAGYGVFGVLFGVSLSGLIRPSAGRVRFGGVDTTGSAPAAIVAAGPIHVPEGRRIFANLSVRERLGQSVDSMSGGEQQMVAIGRGLMGRPRLLILDEPSLGLSPLLVEALFGLIGRLHGRGLSILLVEQNVLQSLGVASRAYVIEHGAVALQGDAAGLLRDPRLKAVYLGM